MNAPMGARIHKVAKREDPPLNLDAVRERAEWFERANERAGGPLGAYVVAAIQSARDVPALLAEIERLRAERGAG